MQRRAVLQITSTFKISFLLGIEAIAGLILINFHLQKLGGRFQLRVHSLSSNHILRSLISLSLESLPYQYTLLLNSLTKTLQIWKIISIKFFHLLIFSTQNFSLVIELLTLSLIIFLFIYLTSTLVSTSSLTSNNLTIQPSNLQTLLSLYSLLWILALRTILLYSSYIFIFMINLSQKLSIALKLNSLLLDMVSIKQPSTVKFPKLLLLWTQSMW